MGGELAREEEGQRLGHMVGEMEVLINVSQWVPCGTQTELKMGVCCMHKFDLLKGVIVVRFSELIEAYKV